MTDKTSLDSAIPSGSVNVYFINQNLPEISLCIKYAIVTCWNTIKTLLCILAFALLWSTASVASTGREIGWKTFPYGPDDYSASAAEACRLTAERHLGTKLHHIDPISAHAAACFYPHFTGGGVVQNYAWTSLVCEEGYTLEGDRCVPEHVSPSAHCKPGESPNASTAENVGNPISVASGEKIEAAIDYVVPGAKPLSIKRIYRSQLPGGSEGFHNLGWRSNHSMDLRLNGFTMTDFPSKAWFKDENGSTYTFDHEGNGVYKSQFYKADLRFFNNDKRYWVLTAPDGHTSDFVRISGDAAILMRQTWPDGYQKIYQRQSATEDAGLNEDETRLHRVVDSLGRSLVFNWNGNLLASIAVSDGTLVEYTYEATETYDGEGIQGTERLISATLRPADGGTPRTTTYHYEKPNGPWLLTGITDARGVRYATFDYDHWGRATLSEHDGGADRVTVSYDDTNIGTSNPTRIRTVTNALGKQTVYTHEWLGDFLALTNVNGIASSNCAPSNTSITYDANGYRSQLTDAEGNQTLFVTNTAGLETQRIEGVGSAVARQIDTEWDQTWRVPTKITTANSVTDLTYDAGGRLTLRKVTDATPHTTPYVTAGATREWRYSYINANQKTYAGPVWKQSLSVLNDSAEDQSLSGWTLEKGLFASIVPSLNSGAGSRVFSTTTGGDAALSQTVALPALSDDEIDVGGGMVTVKWRQRGEAAIAEGGEALLNRTGSTTVSAQYSDRYSGAKAIDSSTHSYWATVGPVPNSYITYKHPTAVSLSAMKIRASWDISTRPPLDFDIQKSTDGGTTWQTVMTYNDATTWPRNTVREFSLGGTHTAADWKIFIRSIHDNQRFAGFSDWQFVEDHGPNGPSGDVGGVEVSFLDSANNVIGSVESSKLTTESVNWWQDRQFTVKTPTLARSVKVALICDDTYAGSVGCNVEFDAITAEYHPKTSPMALTITNPSFENGLSGWTKISGDATTNTYNYVGNVLQGINAYTPFAVSQTVDLPFEADSRSVRLSWRQSAYNNPGQGNGMAKLAFLDHSGNVLGTEIASTAEAFASWTLRTLEGDAPADATQARITLSCIPGGGPSCDVLIDDVKASFQADPEVQLALLSAIDGPLPGIADTVSYEYDAHGNLSAVENELGHRTDILSVNTVGQPTQIRDPNHILTDIVYDSERRVSSITVDPDGKAATTSFIYDAIGQIKRVILPDNAYLDYTYNNARRLTGIANAAGEKLVFTHDHLGNVLTVDTKASGGAIAASRSFVYDELGRVIKAIGANSQETLYGYNRNDQLTSMTDPRGELFSYGFDALNRLIKQTDPDLGETEFTLRTDGALEKVEDAENLSTHYVRNGFGEVIRRNSPDTGLTDYVYDARGLVTQMTDARGVVTNYSYDQGGRLLLESFPVTPSQNVTYTYDSTANGNKGIGRLTSVTDSAGATHFVYDAYGNVVAETRTTGVQAYPVAYTYDVADKPTSITYPSGRVIELSYDTAGRVSSINTRETAAAPAVSVLSGIHYFPMAEINQNTSQWSLAGGMFGNGLLLTFGHDLDGRLSFIDLAPPSPSGPAVQSLLFSYDLTGNIASITDGVAPLRTQNFIYDNLSRLTQATGLYGTIDYSYDLVGNRLTRVVDNNGSVGMETYAYASGTHRLSSMTRTGAGALHRDMIYTSSGQLKGETWDGGNYYAAYSIDDAGRTASAFLGLSSLVSYTYDAFEQRVLKTTDGVASVHYVYDLGGRLIAEHDGVTGQALREYIYIGLMPVGFIGHSGVSPVLYFVHTDQVMNPVKMTDASGVMVWDRVTTPFGEEVLAAGALTQPLQFPGQYKDSETGFFQNWHRDYDPSLGRYIQSDPIGLAGGINTYGYVGGNPLIYVDPVGLTPVPRGQRGNGGIRGEIPATTAIVFDSKDGVQCTCGFVPSGPDVDVDFFKTPGFEWTKLVDGFVEIYDPPKPEVWSPGSEAYIPSKNHRRLGGNTPLGAITLQKTVGFLWWGYGWVKDGGKTPGKYLDDLNSGVEPSINNSCVGFFNSKGE